MCVIRLPDYDVPILTENVCNICLPDYDVLILMEKVCYMTLPDYDVPPSDNSLSQKTDSR